MTSIELFIEELKELKLIREDLKITLSLLIGKYKEKHKQEIVKAFDEGQEYEYQYHINNAPKFDSETYYQETFVSKGSNECQFEPTQHK